jgi:Uma2 family endonuclease
LPPAMPRHGLVCGKVFFALELFGRQTGFGYAIPNDSAVQTERDPDTVRGADVCFYSNARWPQSEVGDRIPPVPPDVAVEVLSPRNRPADVREKVAEYLTVGVSVVMIVDPKNRTVAIHRLGGDPATVLGDADVLEGLAELPGFVCPVARFFG